MFLIIIAIIACYLPFQNLWPFRNSHGRFDTFTRFGNGLAVSKRLNLLFGRFETANCSPWPF